MVDVPGGDRQRMRDHVLHLTRMLGRRVDLHAAVLAVYETFSAAYEAFGVPSAQRTPDCQPARLASSASMKLKKAPTLGWQ